VTNSSINSAPTDDALQWAPTVRVFKTGAMIDAGNRAAEHWHNPILTVTTSNDLMAFAGKCGATVVITTTIPVGFVQPEIDAWAKACKAAGLPVLQVARPWDRLFWPHATAGFFKLKERNPAALAKLKLLQPERST
jgi:deoxyribodipyrimidine photo-lyase